MKKITSLLLSLLIASMMFATSAFAAEQEVDIQVDGQQVQFDTLAPIIVDGYTWAPQEALFEALGLAEDFQFEQAQQIDDAVYVPVRMLAETIGYQIGWNGETRTVTLEKPVVEGSRGYLWKIEHAGNTVYLLGSIHVAKPDMYPLHSAIEAAFEESAYLGTEIDMSQAGTEEVQQLIAEYAFYQDGTSLKDHISEETYTRLNEYLVENDLPEGMLDSFKPWTIESFISTNEMLKYGYTAPGIDAYFTNKAIERGIPILALETYELQLRVFDDLPEAFQEQSLRIALEQYEDSTYIDTLSEIWKSGDEEMMVAIIESLKAYDEMYYNTLLLDRNVGMTDMIETYLNDPDGEVFFIIAGAAHMPGEDGVVKMLQDRGYTVEKAY